MLRQPGLLAHSTGGAHSTLLSIVPLTIFFLPQLYYTLLVTFLSLCPLSTGTGISYPGLLGPATMWFYSCCWEMILVLG